MKPFTFGPLTPRQKARLSILAKQAHATCGDGKEKDWRYAQTRAAVGFDSLTQANQSHYKKLEAHFASMIPGKEGEAFAAQMKSGRPGAAMSEGEEDTHAARGHWMAKIAAALTEFAAYGITPAYVEFIARQQYRCEMDECSARQLQNLFFTVTNRGRAKARKLATA